MSTAKEFATIENIFAMTEFISNPQLNDSSTYVVPNTPNTPNTYRVVTQDRNIPKYNTTPVKPSKPRQ